MFSQCKVMIPEALFFTNARIDPWAGPPRAGQISEFFLRTLLENMMRDIHDSCVQYGKVGDGPVNYLAGANVAGFVKVADAMLSYGHV